jgi:protein-S-isoprenylcysteine O-methyltransferase Ste14
MAFKILFGIALFAGLPFVGWGVTDLSGFIGHPARLAYVILIVLLQTVTVIRWPEVGRGNGEGKKAVRRQRIAVLLLQVLSIAILFAAPYGDRRNFSILGGFAAGRFLGLALVASGFILMILAESRLGRQFSVQVAIQDAHQLITSGPYRRLRHPRYLGILAFNAGIALVFRSWMALVLTAILALVLLWRIHDEEGLLGQEFGAEWEAYARRSWRLIPFVF